MFVEGAGQGGGARLDACLGQAVVDVVWREQAEPGMVVFEVVPAEEVATAPRESWSEPKRCGKAGRYLSVLNCASE